MKNQNACQKHLVIIVCICLFSSLAAAESSGDNESWRILERGAIALEKGEPGEALRLCDIARTEHKAQIEKRISILQKSLLPREVKKAGDDIQTVYDILKKRQDSDPVEVLDGILLNHPAVFFGKSIQKLMSWLDTQKIYPEADVMTGKIYESEGEYKQALFFYTKAWENRAFLDIPEERYSLSYRMADLAGNISDLGSQEIYLLSVVQEDPVFGKPGEESPTLTAMMHTLISDQSTDKFFNLYRHSNFIALKAYQDLASLYYYGPQQRLDRALPAAVLSCCISVTRLSKALEQADFDYVYSGLPDLFLKSGKKAEIVSWAKDTEIWKSFLLLASVLYDNNEQLQAISIWTALAGYCPDQKTVRLAAKALELRKR